MVDLSLDIKPTDINLSTYNDLLVIDGDLVLTNDADPNNGGANPILQDILQTLRYFLGEWFLNTTEGLPWFQEIMVKNPDLSKIETILMNAILGRPGVTQLTEFTLTPNFSIRLLSVSFRCITTKGLVIYSGNLNPATGGQG